MIILDVETTGANPHTHSLVSIGAIDFENPEEKFYEECRIWDGAHIEPEALAVNGYTEAEIRDPSKKRDGEILTLFLDWILGRADNLIGGQNPFFDTGFLEATAAREHINFPIARRIIDLHSICYFHMTKRNIKPPSKNKKSDLNSDAIMTYVGIGPEPKPHVAINGAIWEAEAFSRLFYDRALFKQFEHHKIPWN